MKKDKLRGLDPAEMEHRLREMDESAFRLRFQMSMGQTDGLKKLREIRRDRARLLTYLRERELAGAAERGSANRRERDSAGAKK